MTATVDALRQDLRQAIRGLGRTPGFTLIVVLTLALGIGTNTAIFSMVDQLLLRPLPYPDGDQVVSLHEVDTADASRSDTNPGNWLDWQRQSKTLEGIAAWDPGAMTLTGLGEPERLQTLFVSHEFFPVLGVPPFVGRVISEQDDRPDAPRVVVLSYGLWQRKFNSDPSVVGRIIQLNEEPNEIIGVMPPTFRFVTQDTDFWTAYRLDRTFAWRDNAGRFMSTIGRIRRGGTLSDARAEMTAIGTALQSHPRNEGMTVEVVPLRDELVGSVRESLLVLYGAVVLLLAIACLNVANLLLARSMSRSREIAVRASIGAGRGVIVRQFVTESVLLAAVGGLVGVLFARWSLNTLFLLAPTDLIPLTELRVDRWLLLYAIGISLMTGIVVGLLPALVTTRRSLAGILRTAGTTSTHAPRVRQALVVGQVAMTVILLTGAGLLMRTVAELTAADAGFDRRDLLTMEVDLPRERYDEQRIPEFFRQVRQRLEELPGVESAAASWTLPVTGIPVGGTSVRVLGQQEVSDSEASSTAVRVVTPDYFRTLDIPVLQGREFNDADQAPNAPLVFVVNQAFVRTILRGQDPLASSIRVAMQEENPYAPIVGVVGDVSEGSLWNPARPTVFYNHGQIPLDAMVIFLRAPASTQLTRAAIQVVHDVDPSLAVANIRTVEAALGESVGRERLLALVSAAFGVSGLLLAALGLYGLLAFVVSERTKEIGVRMALGARLGAVVRDVLGSGLQLVVIGAAIGMAGALLLLRSIGFLFFGVTPYDPRTYAAVLGVLALVATAAALVPARRAARVDPVIALRAD